MTARILTDSDARALSQMLAWYRSVRTSAGAGPFGLTPTASELAAMMGGSGVPTARFKVQSVHTDYLTCRTYDGTTTGTEDINVAMPWDLRRTPFHGLTVNGITYTYSSDIQRSATNGTTTETHVITPPYFTNCEIWAFRAVGGGTSVTVSSDGLVWQDMNVSGRAWAVKAT